MRDETNMSEKELAIIEEWKMAIATCWMRGVNYDYGTTIHYTNRMNMKREESRINTKYSRLVTEAYWEA